MIDSISSGTVIDNLDDEDVAIIGLGFRIPSGEKDSCINTPMQLWNALINKFDGVRDSTIERYSDNFYKSGEVNSNSGGLLPLDQVTNFDALFFGFLKDDTANIDPQLRILLKCVWEALEDASIDPLSLRGSNTSVFIGSSSHDWLDMSKHSEDIQENMLGATPYTLSNKLSYCFDFRGESSLTIETACSSSSIACKLGYESIKNRSSNLSIIGGVNLILDPHKTKSYSHLGILSKLGRCRSFDKDADGYVRSESAGIVVLKNLKEAIKDNDKIYCVIKSSTSLHDGKIDDKLNYYSPSKQAQSNNINNALNQARGIEKFDIDMVECHGTGTPTGDPIELEAISMSLNPQRDRKDPILLGSIKSNIGHTEASSGVVGLIKCCLMFKNRQFVPNINFNNPNPNIKFDEWNLKVLTKVTPFKSNKKTSILVCNYGISGVNSATVLTEYNSSNKLSNNVSNNRLSTKYLIPFSANSIASLKRYIELVINYSKEHSFIDFVQNQIFSKCLNLSQRSVIIASNWDEFINNSREESNQIKSNHNLVSNITVQNKDPITVFIFCGQSTQYKNMGLSLYSGIPYFKKQVDSLDREFAKVYGYSVFERIRSLKDDDELLIHNTVIAQPCIVILQIALLELYKYYGIKASFLMGHSLGEVSAAYCSGMIDLEVLIKIIYQRSKVQAKTSGCGKMLSISIGKEEYNRCYASRYPSIEIACLNSPSSIVIAGKEDILKEIEQDLKDSGVFCAFLGSLSSFHTSSQKIVKDEILNIRFTSRAPLIPTFSTLTSNLFDNSSPSFNSDYIYNSIIKPVLFEPAISNLYNHIESNDLGREVTFIELAPHSTLAFYLKQMIPTTSGYFKDFNGKTNINVYSPLHKRLNDYQEFQNTIASLYCQGYNNINFKNQFNNVKPVKQIELPLYQWDDLHTFYWKENPKNAFSRINGPPIDHLGISNSINSPFKSFQTFIDIKKQVFSSLKDFKVFKDNNQSFVHLLPPSAYLDNILKIYPNRDIEICKIKFKVPLLLKESVTQCMQTNIFSMNSKQLEFKVQFHFKDRYSTSEWLECASANIELLNQVELKNNKYDIGEMIRQCSFTVLPKEEFYQFIKLKVGLQYTGEFKRVNQCFIGDKCSISIVSLDGGSDLFSSKRNSFFNLPILETFIHSGISLLLSESSLSTSSNYKFELNRIEDLNYYSSNIPLNFNEVSNIYIYSKLNKIYENSLSLSMIIMLQDGTVLVEIEELIYKSQVPIINDMGLKLPINQVYSSYLQSKDSVLQVLSLESINKSNTIVYGNKVKSNSYNIFVNSIKSSTNQDIYEISTIQQLKDLVFSNDLNRNNNSTILFIKSIDQLNISNYLEITLEYNQINHLLLEFNCCNKFRHILVTCDGYSNNYLASYLIGSARSFISQKQLQLLALDFDSNSILESISNKNISTILASLLNNTSNVEREYQIKGNQVYYERYKKESDSLLKLFKTNSIEVKEYSLCLSPKLEYKLEQKQLKVGPNQVEIRVKAAGINYSDYLAYCRVSKIDSEGKIDFGLDFSGVVENVGNSTKDFNIGDQVYGLAIGSTRSHIIVDSGSIYQKPHNLNYVEAAAIPMAYLSSLYSLYYIGNLGENDSVLIHLDFKSSIGLAALELLKWKKHKSLIFVCIYGSSTSDFENERNYLKNIYGSLISGIFSRNSKHYIKEIKMVLKESNIPGIDIMLSTLSCGAIDSKYFKCLKTSGARVIEIESANNSLPSNENNYYTQFSNIKKLKFNCSYSNIDIRLIPKLIIKEMLSVLTNAFESGHLSIIPIKEFSNRNIKQAIEYINSVGHIGKIVVNSDNQDEIKELLLENDIDVNGKAILKSNNNTIKKLGKTILIAFEESESEVILEIIKWVINYYSTISTPFNSIFSIIVLSQAKIKWNFELLMNQQKHHSNIQFKFCDISLMNSLELSIDEVLNRNKDINNIDSIIYSVSSSYNFSSQKDNPIVQSAINLHNLSLKFKISNFILLSSSSSILHESPVSCILESLSRHRFSLGLPSVYASWCSLFSSSENKEVLSSENISPISVLLSSLCLQTQNPELSTSLLFYDFEQFLNKNDNFKNQIIYSKLNKEMKEFNQFIEEKSTNTTAVRTPLNTIELVLNKISELLSIDSNSINTSLRLINLGTDSILFQRLYQWINNNFNNVITLKQLQTNSINSIIQIINQNKSK